MSRRRRQQLRRQRRSKRAKLDSAFQRFLGWATEDALKLAYEQFAAGLIVGDVLDEVVPFDWPKWTFKSGRKIRFAGTAGGEEYRSIRPPLQGAFFPAVIHETPRGPRKVGDEYTCERCHGVYTAAWTAEDAAAEATALFGAEVARTGKLVCDDCFAQLMGRGNA